MAINRAVQAAKNDRALPIPEATADKLRVVMQARCKDDRWDRAMLTCLARATDSHGLTGCFDLLSRAQQDTLMADFAPIVSGRQK